MIQPIEPRYAGCLFRSRLKARWAVFFDSLDIEWQYEPEGYPVGLGRRDHAYLPDFWLPHFRLWVEVKDSEEGLDLALLVSAVIPHYGLPDGPSGIPVHDISRPGDRLLVIGPVHDPRRVGVIGHSILGFWNGDVYRTYASFSVSGLGRACFGRDEVIADDRNGLARGSRPHDVVQGIARMGVRNDYRVAGALTGARSARFGSKVT